jgi:hypothetical protein
MGYAFNGGGAGVIATRSAEPRHAERILGLMTVAFAADPPNRWLFPEPKEYLRHFPQSRPGGPRLSSDTAGPPHHFVGLCKTGRSTN